MAFTTRRPIACLYFCQKSSKTTYLFWRRIASKLYIDAATVDCDGDHDNIDEKDDENNEDNDESVVCSK